jgi:hypothetical protein
VGRGGLVITENTLTPKVTAMPAKFHAAMVALTYFFRDRVEGKARTGASWTDRTGNARQGLTATPDIGVGYYAVDLFHQVPYGIWLEVRWSGRYAIIVPTVKAEGREAMKAARSILRKMS